MRVLLVSWCGLAMAAAAIAQQHVVVPSGFESVDGNRKGLVPGLQANDRSQQLIGASHLTSMTGRWIQAIEFRRAKFLRPYPAGSLQLQVTMSTHSTPPVQCSEVFDQNVGSTPQVVFQGLVSAPASPMPGAQPTAWTPDNVIRVPLQTPYLYTGGTLCLDMLGVVAQGQTSDFWSVDAVTAVTDAAVQSMGPGTPIDASGVGSNWLAMNQGELTIGGQAQMQAVGAPFGLTLAMLGHPSPWPLPLNALGIGAPGAMAYLDQVYASSLVALMPVIPGFPGGIGDWEVPLPQDPAFLGAEFGSQWLELSQWNVSNGLRWTIGSQPPALDMAFVDGMPADLVGQRRVNSALIVRFELMP
jgi:hypothetical protein